MARLTAIGLVDMLPVQLHEKIKEAFKRCTERDNSVQFNVTNIPFTSEFQIDVISVADETLSRFAVGIDRNGECYCEKFIGRYY